MTDIPDRFIPNEPATIGDEPDPPRAGWFDDTALPTDTDVCPHCGELVEYANQHAGYETDGSSWHRRCWLLSLGFTKTDKERDRKYYWSETVEGPDTVIEIEVWAGTFVMGDWKISLEADQELTDADKRFIQAMQAADGVKAEAAEQLVQLMEFRGKR